MASESSVILVILLLGLTGIHIGIHLYVIYCNTSAVTCFMCGVTLLLPE